jgi:hypothetical protein
MVAMMLVTARPVGVLVSTPSQRPHVDTASGQLMQSGGDFPNGASEPVHGDNHELVTFTKPAHAFHPARSIATGAPGRGVGEYPIGNDARGRDDIVLLIDTLLSGGDPEVGGSTHRDIQQVLSDNPSRFRLPPACVNPSNVIDLTHR